MGRNTIGILVAAATVGVTTGCWLSSDRHGDGDVDAIPDTMTPDDGLDTATDPDVPVDTAPDIPVEPGCYGGGGTISVEDPVMLLDDPEIKVGMVIDWSGSEYRLLWYTYRLDPPPPPVYWDIRLSRFDGRGDAVGETTILRVLEPGETAGCRLASRGAELGILWSESELFFELRDPTGAILSPAVAVVPDDVGGNGLIATDHGFAMWWQPHDGMWIDPIENTSVMFLGPSGEPLSGAIALTDHGPDSDVAVNAPDLVWTGSSLAALWKESWGYSRPMLALVDTDGGVRTTALVEEMLYLRGLQLAWTGDVLLVAWNTWNPGTDTGTFYYVPCGPDGTPLGDPVDLFTVSGDMGGVLLGDVQWTGDGFGIVWTEVRTIVTAPTESHDEVQALFRFFSPDGDPLTETLTLHTSSEADPRLFWTGEELASIVHGGDVDVTTMDMEYAFTLHRIPCE